MPQKKKKREKRKLTLTDTSHMCDWIIRFKNNIGFVIGSLEGKRKDKQTAIYQ